MDGDSIARGFVLIDGQLQAMADELRLAYIETSAKDPPQNVDAAFHELVRIVKSFPSEGDEVR